MAGSHTMIGSILKGETLPRTRLDEVPRSIPPLISNIVLSMASFVGTGGLIEHLFHIALDRCR